MCKECETMPKTMNIISNNAVRKEQSFHSEMTWVIVLFVFYRLFSANSMGGSDIKIEPKAQKLLILMLSWNIVARANGNVYLNSNFMSILWIYEIYAIKLELFILNE